MQFCLIEEASTSAGIFSCPAPNLWSDDASATLGLTPPSGTAPEQPTSIQLGAVIMLQNQLCTGAVAWSSSNIDVAQVNSSGLVRATTIPGTSIITATSIVPTLQGGPPLSAVATISVTNSGGALVTIE